MFNIRWFCPSMLFIIVLSNPVGPYGPIMLPGSLSRGPAGVAALPLSSGGTLAALPASSVLGRVTVRYYESGTVSIR
eukprot:234608-Hanusia_phi.AAC.1